MQDFQGFFIVCAVADQVTKEGDKTLYLGVSDSGKVTVQLQQVDNRLSQIWSLDSDGYLINRSRPTMAIGYTSSSNYSLVLVDKKPPQAVQWNLESLYEGFFVANSIPGFVLAAHYYSISIFDRVTDGTVCELQLRSMPWWGVKNQLWSLHLAHELKEN